MTSNTNSNCRACPAPSIKTTSEFSNSNIAPTPGKKISNPPAERYPTCNVVNPNSSTTGGTGVADGTTTVTDNVTQIPGPAGPMGLGFQWSGPWEEDIEYKAQNDPDNPLADVVYFDGIVWVCIVDHTSDLGNAPYWAEDGGANWSKWNDKSVSIPEKEKNILEKLEAGWNDVMDWVENADLVDWLVAGAAVAGVIWAGSEIMDALDPPEQDQNTDQNVSYNGSSGYSGTATAPSLKSVVTSLCEYSGIVYDTSALSTEPCEFVIASNTQIRSLLEQLSVAYQFDMVESGGVLKFSPRNTTAVDTITLEDMGFSTSTDLPSPYTAKRYQGITLPRSVSLTYISPDVDYNQYTQKSDYYTFEEGQDINLSVPIVLTHEKAKYICETTIINAHLERENFKFNTSYKFIHLEPGDCVNSPLGLIRIIKIEEVEEGILEFEATDAGGTSAIEGSGLNVQLPTPSNNYAPVVTMTSSFFIDPPTLNDQDKAIRIFCAVTGFGKQGWTGAAVYMSEDNGDTYKQVANTSVESTVGLVEVVTPYNDYHVWDTTTEITVKLTSGTLISKSEIAVLNGANHCMVGQEVIAFCNAELIADKTYKLTKLMRGRQGSEIYCASHVANELFVGLDNLIKIEFNDADRGTTKKFKVVSIGAGLDSVVGKDVKIISNNTQMWNVYGTNGALQTDQSWKIQWRERARFDNQLRDYTTQNHDVDWAGYGIAILNPLTSDVVRKFTLTSDSYVYTAAEQIQDFGQLLGNVKITVMQMSSKFGSGYPLTINT